ncbi:uncharacterized protein LOC112271515 [Brachypodium distachyon]|uniref:KIB1-4 beta-propeller domain-containing protein n=1 Tax=Brachypodium distachyon TaxID=15368 RepID=A0A0Q3F2Q8_BRADI|nr:uncharacterized protein LOC112271515 [Brachypodium distachyon]KQJ93710.1 hypothetical protein BRADI_3g06251v3 [Brachypodium distachyon]|eukprot:XP_024316499.1 uncharacterized protein LOC112271515 [Brachypodium distachyon]
MASAFETWASLNQDVLGRIFRSLPTLTDRVYASAVCKHWRFVAVQTENQPAELPWLLMPSTGRTFHFRVFGGSTHQENSEHVPVGARFCGSFPGGWFVVQLHAPRGRYALLNVPSGNQIALPDNMEAPVRSNSGIQHSNLYPVLAIHAAVLSAAPTPDGAYIVAALTSGKTNVAFWRPGMAHWSPPLHTEVGRRASWADEMIPTATEDGFMEDVVHYRRGDFECFYVLTSTEFVYNYEPVITEDGALTMRRTCTAPTARMFRGVGGAGAGSIARYLVVSGKDLLIVRRFASLPVAPNVIRLHVVRLQDRQGARYTLNCWDMPPGQLLFLGRGCSRAYTTGVYTKPGGYIYFLNAEKFPGSTTIGYHCSDTGRCDYRRLELEIQRVLPRGPASNCSPWIWFFH